MTKEEEKKAADEAAAAEAAAKEAEKKAKEAEEAGDPSQTDYEELAKKERARADAAKAASDRIAEERKTADAAFKAREEERKRKEAEATGGGADAPLTESKLQEILDRDRAERRKESQEVQARAIARQLTASDAEAEAAFLYWKNRVVPTGNLEDDVRFAVGGLNHKRVVAQNEELARAIRAREGVNNDSSGTFRDTPPGTGPKISAEEKASYERAGFEYDTKEKVYKKKLPNGKFLIKDPVSKQQVLR